MSLPFVLMGDGSRAIPCGRVVTLERLPLPFISLIMKRHYQR